MNLQSPRDARNMVRVGLIGTENFGAIFLAQSPSPGDLEVATIADPDSGRAKVECRRVGGE
jgi:predicted homoserine dehydrogenase-like protein